MKNKIIILISLLFFFIPSVNALQVNSNSFSAVINNDGSADVTETFDFLGQRDTVYNLVLFNVKDVKISDLSITDNLGSHYEYAKSLEDNKAFFYTLDDQGYKKILTYSVVSENTIITIKYKLSNVTVKFNDGTYGIDWFLVSRAAGHNIRTFNTSIKFENEEILSKISKVDVVGVNKTSNVTTDKSLSFTYNDIDSTQSLRLLVSFAQGVTFTNAKSVDKAYAEYSDDIIDGRDLVATFYSYSTKNFLITFLLIVIGGLAILIGSIIYVRYGTHDEYYGMETKDKKTINKIKDLAYYDSVPCQGDLYKIFFTAGYFKLLKNKSDMLGTILLKMYLNGNLELIPGKNGKNIRLRNDEGIDRDLDQDLYNIMLEASDMKVISDTKFNKFAKEHFVRIMTWYNMGYSETITDEFNRGHVSRGSKIGKTTKLIFDDNFVDYGNKILSMKKYLLNFNQVPRQTKLSEETYKLLLLSAQLLGIGEQLADEILRKNPNNIYAKKLKEFQSVNYIYEKIYAVSLTSYRQTVKNNEIYNYDEMSGNLMQSGSNMIVYKRKSKL